MLTGPLRQTASGKGLWLLPDQDQPTKGASGARVAAAEMNWQ
jgi:hypothetical protein